jgi:hypothetical protein
MSKTTWCLAILAAAALCSGQTSSSGSSTSGAGSTTGTASAQQQSAGRLAGTGTARRNAAATSETFGTDVADDLLFQLAGGMESRNARKTLAAFDPAKFVDYGRFSDQVNAWFRDHTSFRVYYKVKQAMSEDGRGVALVDFQFEATPAMEGTAPVRRHQQMRFTFERGAKGWKIVEFSPRNLFS